MSERLQCRDCAEWYWSDNPFHDCSFHSARYTKCAKCGRPSRTAFCTTCALPLIPLLVMALTDDGSVTSIETNQKLGRDAGGER